MKKRGKQSKKRKKNIKERRDSRDKIDKRDLREKRNIINLFARYILALVFSAKNLFVFYFIFTPLTIYPVAFLLSLFYPVSVYSISIFVEGKIIELIGACIAGSAYFLLFLLNLSTPNLNFLKRVKILVFDFALLLVLNIARIFLLSIMFLKESVAFNITHFVLWHILSIVFVFCVWILTIRVFNVKDIPFWSDFLYLKKLIKRKN